ncbi:LOW QUALITY PROTEIN: putative helicase MOV-10 [Kipferlia bialata]|uniref:Helicase MOV-10 n=1 Tax=Kipferlia bialata TaxID=797122 RepID=A0A9K3CUY5_9EUKA|nr:LOW QUALITY PROTEIN: putative helicase MOV-10 [Kipferlia bialata]
MKSGSKKNRVTCQVCREIVPISGYAAHMGRHGRLALVYCCQDGCARYSAVPESLDAHCSATGHRRYDNPLYLCSRCPKEYNSFKDLVQHECEFDCGRDMLHHCYTSSRCDCSYASAYELSLSLKPRRPVQRERERVHPVPRERESAAKQVQPVTPKHVSSATSPAQPPRPVYTAAKPVQPSTVTKTAATASSPSSVGDTKALVTSHTITCEVGKGYVASTKLTNLLPGCGMCMCTPLKEGGYRGLKIEIQDGTLALTFQPTEPMTSVAVLVLTSTVGTKKSTMFIRVTLKGTSPVSQAAMPVTPYVPLKKTLKAERNRIRDRVRAPPVHHVLHERGVRCNDVLLGGKVVGKTHRQNLGVYRPVPREIRDIFQHRQGALPVDAFTLTVTEEGQEEREAAADQHRLPALTDTTTSPSGPALSAIYTQRLTLCVHLEELQQAEDIRHYDVQRITPKRSGRFLRFDGLTGLAESRPSVSVGDTVGFLGLSGSSEYMGRIAEVRLASISVLFGEPPSLSPGRLRFLPSKGPVMRMHASIGRVKSTGLIHRLCPSRDSALASLAKMITCPTVVKEDVWRPLLGRGFTPNTVQVKAMSRALAVTDKRPYLVFGPPGTGKTAVLVALAAIRISQGQRILLCATSNAAADHLAERLMALAPALRSQIVRVCAYHRSVRTIPDNILPLVPMDRDGHRVVPKDLSPWSCVITTCSTAAVLPRDNHIRHILVDEAASSLETDVISALQVSPSASIVLGGDPRQLGPIVTNGICRKLGYGVSAMERLMGDPGMKGRWTMLTDNYRNHPAILHPFSAMFYRESLVPNPPLRANNLLKSSLLPTPGFPLAFCGVLGKCRREGHSPSWSNPEEVDRVQRTVLTLVSEHRLPLEEIAVITPYRLQASKIRNALRRTCGEGVAVGSVEAMQGREFDAVVISTVRTLDAEDIQTDIRHVLGFVAHPRRLNVSISRARGMVVIVGHAGALATDMYWLALLRYIKEHGGCTGAYSAIDPSSAESDAVRAVRETVRQALRKRQGGRESEQTQALDTSALKGLEGVLQCVEEPTVTEEEEGEGESEGEETESESESESEGKGELAVRFDDTL